MNGAHIIDDLKTVFGDSLLAMQRTVDDIPTLWVTAARAQDVLRHLKTAVERPFRVLFDLTAIDERTRKHRAGQPPSDFTVVYHLQSWERNEDIRVKVPLQGAEPSLPSISRLWQSANWYEREIWDLFGITFTGHPHLRRILLPPTWEGHPLRKDHPARATELGPFRMPEDRVETEQQALQFRPEEWGLASGGDASDHLFLNLGPQHPGTHGLLRVILQLDGEVIKDSVLDIGYHHRGAEKMAERQTWHTFIPYTDRVDYFGGVMNNLAYVLAVEKLAGIEVPDRVKVIRVLLAELFRIQNHLVWYGTFAQDLGALSPVFYTFTDRERIFAIVEALCGGRMHPAWFRIGGVAHDLPKGWDRLVRELLDYLPARLREYDRIVMQNSIFKARTVGVGAYTLDEAIDWGVTGPGLRACGLAWDLRKTRPYSGYDQFDFDVPTAVRGDCYDRGVVRIEEIRQSMRIVEQCLRNMPAGDYKSDHPLTTPPRKERTLKDIETLITHFLGTTWGPVLPTGEACVAIEATKGVNSYYLVSDGSTNSYRTRIRTPSFPHMQMVPTITRGAMIADLLAVLGSIDFILADLDR